MADPRTLIAILVYGGEDFVPRCLASAAPLVDDSTDVLVLDDCTPDVGFSNRMRDLCQMFGLAYYRSPRNLGIPRAMNLGMLRAQQGRYDHVIICNSDVVFPHNLVSAMTGVASANAGIGTVTAWSTNVSSFSLPNVDPDRFLANIEAVDRTSIALADEFGDVAFDIPTGVGFCLLVPTTVIESVGLMDPIFGRGYCEEVDFCRRVAEHGLRNVLAPGVFVYHMGGASTRPLGILEPGQTTVWSHERIIDERHPDYRSVIESFVSAGDLERLQARGVATLVRSEASNRGYVVEMSWLRRDRDDDPWVRVTVPPSGAPAPAAFSASGFSASIPVDQDRVIAATSEFVGAPPIRLDIYEDGPLSERAAHEAAKRMVPMQRRVVYPERVGSPTP